MTLDKLRRTFEMTASVSNTEEEQSELKFFLRLLIKPLLRLTGAHEGYRLLCPLRAIE